MALDGWQMIRVYCDGKIGLLKEGTSTKKNGKFSTISICISRYLLSPPPPYIFLKPPLIHLIPDSIIAALWDISDSPVSRLIVAVHQRGSREAFNRKSKGSFHSYSEIYKLLFILHHDEAEWKNKTNSHFSWRFPHQISTIGNRYSECDPRGSTNHRWQDVLFLFVRIITDWPDLVNRREGAGLSLFWGTQKYT